MVSEAAPDSPRLARLASPRNAPSPVQGNLPPPRPPALRRRFSASGYLDILVSFADFRLGKYLQEILISFLINGWLKRIPFRKRPLTTNEET